VTLGCQENTGSKGRRKKADRNLSEEEPSRNFKKGKHTKAKIPKKRKAKLHMEKGKQNGKEGKKKGLSDREASLSSPTPTGHGSERDKKRSVREQGARPDQIQPSSHVEKSTVGSG